MEDITRHAADTILTHRATRALVAVIERSVTAAPITAGGAGVSCLGRQQRAGTARARRLEAIVLNPPRTMSGWGQYRHSERAPMTSGLTSTADLTTVRRTARPKKELGEQHLQVRRSLEGYLPIFVLTAFSAFAQPTLTSSVCCLRHSISLPPPGVTPGHIFSASALQ
jgi:hypothetical protein